MNRSRISRKLEFAARTILTTLAPKLSRIARIVVRFQDDAETASTDGNVVVIMPRDFLGAPIPEDAPVTLGLLAHEMGHWVQPLEQVTEIARTRGAPGWLANIAMDIHAETFVEAAFPSLKRPLQATRKTAAARMLDKHLRNLAEAVHGDDFRDMAKFASLVARFITDEPWVEIPYKDIYLGQVEIPGRLGDFLNWLGLFHATMTSPDQLPAKFEELLGAFPELLDPPANQYQNGQDGQDCDKGDDEAEYTGETSQPQQQQEDAGEDGDEDAGGEDASDQGDALDGDQDGDAESNDESGVEGDEARDRSDDDAESEATSETDDGADAGDAEEDGDGDNSDLGDGSESAEDEEQDADDDGEGSATSSGIGGGMGSAVEDEGEAGEDDELLSAYPDSDFDALGEMLREEIQHTTLGFHPIPPVLRTIEHPVSEPFPRAQQLAQAIQPRFQSPHAKLEVAAPGRLDRLEMARGAPVPLRMDVQGHESPAIKLVLALDVSSSMFPQRILPAQIAAQAIALAVRDAGGEVVVILFDHKAYISPQEDDSLVFSRHLSAFRGSTSFLFLGEVWRRWPQHQVLLVTDGESSSIPSPLPADRERTSVILIGTNTDVSVFAARSVYLSRLDRLASVLAILLPDRRL